MQQIAGRVNAFCVAFWIRNRNVLMPVAILLIAIAASIRLWNEYRRLLFDTSWFGANDLTTFYNAVQGWFAGRNIYNEPRSAAAYPPASFVILWPLFGWLSFGAARTLFAILTLPCLAALATILVSKSEASDRWEKAFLVMLLLSMNATGVTIGNGQITLIILPALLGGLFLNDSRSSKDSLWPATLLFLVALLKPSIAFAFLWLYALARPAWKQTFLICGGYLALTIFALHFQNYDLAMIRQGWLARGSQVAIEGGPSAYGNLHTWLSSIDLDAWILPASLVAFLALGVWTYAHRETDVWLLLGVTAIFARIWTYHRMYDDLLIVVPMVALFRVAKKQDSLLAGLLLAFATVLNLARLTSISPLRYALLTNLNVLTWIAMLFFLHFQTRRA